MAYLVNFTDYYINLKMKGILELLSWLPQVKQHIQIKQRNSFPEDLTVDKISS